MCDIIDFPKSNPRNRQIVYELTPAARGCLEALIRSSVAGFYGRLEARYCKGSQTPKKRLDLMEALQVFARDWNNTGLNTPQRFNSALELLSEATKFLDYGLPGLYLEMNSDDGK